jgi:hypothetical protein
MDKLGSANKSDFNNPLTSLPRGLSQGLIKVYKAKK